MQIIIDTSRIIDAIEKKIKRVEIIESNKKKLSKRQQKKIVETLSNIFRNIDFMVVNGR